MSTIGIVALSVVAALALFAFFAGIAVLIWLAWTLKRSLAELQAWSKSVYAETAQLLAAHQAESKAIIESAKGSFGAIRTEVKTALEGNQKANEQAQLTHQKTLDATLVDFRRQMQAAIDKINAEALQTVAVRLTQVCVRAEKAIGVLQQLILDTEKSTGFDGGPEEYAPEDSQFGAPPSGYSVSPTARLDQEADSVQQAELFTESPAEV